MSFISEGTPYIPADNQQASGWLIDTANKDIVPVNQDGTAAAIDLTRGVGHGTANRALLNDLCPTGLAMVQLSSAADNASFTTRRVISGNLFPCHNFAPYGYQPTHHILGVFAKGSLSLVGRTLRIRASGTMGCTGTPNLTIDVGLGGNVLATTGALALATTTTPAPWFMSVQATVTTAGSSGVVVSEGFFLYSTSSSVVSKFHTMGNTVRGTGLSVSLTSVLQLTLNATSSASDPANRIQCDTMTCEVLY